MEKMFSEIVPVEIYPAIVFLIVAFILCIQQIINRHSWFLAYRTKSFVMRQTAKNKREVFNDPVTDVEVIYSIMNKYFKISSRLQGSKHRADIFELTFACRKELISFHLQRHKTISAGVAYCRILDRRLRKKHARLTEEERCIIYQGLKTNLEKSVSEKMFLLMLLNTTLFRFSLDRKNWNGFYM